MFQPLSKLKFCVENIKGIHWITRYGINYFAFFKRMNDSDDKS